MLTCWAPGKARAIQGFGGWLVPWLSQQLLQPPCDSQGCLGLQGWDLPSCEGRTDRMDRGYCSALPPVISSCCPQPCSLPLSCRLALVSTRPLKELRKSQLPTQTQGSFSSGYFLLLSLFSWCHQAARAGKGSDPPHCSTVLWSPLLTFFHAQGSQGSILHGWWPSSSLKESGEACAASSLAPACSDTPDACRDRNRG